MLDLERKLTGGCRCGDIRYEFAKEPDEVLVCHCPDCRRSVGAQSVAWVLIELKNFKITKGTLAIYNSSPGVARSFCGRCGTTLTWVGEKQPGRIDVSLGSLDEPGKFIPSRAVYRRHKLPWASEI
jgi:hypothetical protein